MNWLSSFVTPAAPSTPGPLGSQVLSTSGVANYYVGELVEYYSASSHGWIPATIKSINPAGTYNLDCKPEVPADKIRKNVAAGPGAHTSPKYAVGDFVEYFSVSRNGWIPAKIVACTSGGLYDLDCKPGVSADGIRPMSAAEAAGLGGTGATASLAGAGGGTSAPGTVPSLGGGATGSLAGPSIAAQASPLASFEPSSRSGMAGATLPSTFASPLASLPSTGISIDAPVQLLKVERQGSGWRYEVCPEGARLLESQGSRHIAVASICGVYRTGKSYLLNLLLERVQKGLPLFQVGGTTRACTEGLWLWGSMNSDNEREPLLAFLDCEGFGSTDSDRSRDAQLMTLCCLLSSVMVLNTKGALNEGLFNSLALTCKFAEHIEERGNEASRPHLLWVLRDFVLELVDQANNPITPDQYLEQALASAPLAGHDEARSQGARDVRSNLLKFFDRRGCQTLVQPIIDEAKLQSLQDVPYRELRPEFQRGVDALRMQLVSKCNAGPKAIGGQPLSCVAFVGLMKQLVQSINENKMLSIKGAWETVQHSACITLTDELSTRACAALRALGAGDKLPSGAQLPLSDEALSQVFERQRNEIKAEFDSKAVGDESVRKEYWQDLVDGLAREEATVRQKNHHWADEQLGDSLKAWQAWLSNDSANSADGLRIVEDISNLMERMPAAPLSRTTKAALEAAVRRLCAARDSTGGPVAAAAERQALDAQQDTQNHLDRAGAELSEARAQIQALTADIEGYRSREHDLNAKSRLVGDRDASLRSDMDQARAENATHISERARLEEQVRLHGNEKRRLEEDLDQERRRVTGHQEHTGKERIALQGEVERTRQEHLKMLEDARKRSDEDRKHHANTMEGETKRLLESEREAGLLTGKVEAMTAERNLLHHQIAELEAQLRESEGHKGRIKQEQTDTKNDHEKLKKEVDSKDEATRAEIAKRVDMEKRLQEEQARKPKCGCTLQ